MAARIARRSASAAGPRRGGRPALVPVRASESPPPRPPPRAGAPPLPRHALQPVRRRTCTSGTTPTARPRARPGRTPARAPLPPPRPSPPSPHGSFQSFHPSSRPLALPRTSSGEAERSSLGKGKAEAAVGPAPRPRTALPPSRHSPSVGAPASSRRTWRSPARGARRKARSSSRANAGAYWPSPLACPPPPRTSNPRTSPAPPGCRTSGPSAAGALPQRIRAPGRERLARPRADGRRRRPGASSG